MKNQLKERLLAVANEYATKFGEVIGMGVEFWVGDDPDICSFGDTMFFSLDEMRQVVDNLPKYIKRYGSMEAIGNEIREWMDWWLDGTSDKMLERILPRVTHHLRPNINLKSWLDGCPRKDRDAWSGPDAELMKRQMLRDLLEDYCAKDPIDTTIGHIVCRLEREIKQKQVAQ